MTRQIGKYDILNQFYGSPNSILYLAADPDSPEPVAIKTINSSLKNDEQKIAKLKNEYRLTLKIQSRYVAKPIEFMEFEDGFYFVREYSSGLPLKKYLNGPMEIEEFLKIAVQIASGLSDIHSKGIIHKDINPANIIYDPDTESIKIIDFNISSDFSFERPSDALFNAGTLKYISPEQTQRMNRSIDYRTDFYSLGIMFYEMLCGKPPFTSDKPTELIYSHLAKMPPAVSRINEKVPVMISVIIAKLIEKMPEDRYKSADGLVHDLEKCLESLRETGRLTTFELDMKNSVNRIEISKKVYGREKEISELLSIYEDFMDKKKCLLTIGGYSGTGKTTLVNELQKNIAKSEGLFISGKFDQYQRNVPYYAFFKALGNLCDYIFSEPEDSLNRWKEKIKNALAGEAKLLSDKIPKLEKLLGTLPEMKKLTLFEEQVQFKNALKRLLAACSSPEKPLLLFIDDIHIADMGSLEIIEDIMMNDEGAGLFIIACYRDNEVDDSHQLTHTLKKIKQRGGNLKHIELTGMDIDAVTSLIADSFGMDRSYCRELAAVAYEKTNGNPFYLIQFIKHCHDEGLIGFSNDVSRFEWNIDDIKKIPFYDNVVDFLISNMSSLPEDTVGLLSCGACIGQSFETDILSAVTGMDEDSVIEKLKAVVKAEIIRPVENQNDEDRMHFDFCHDRFQQSYYTVLAEDEREKLHLKIARYYEEKQLNDSPEYTLAIAEHYTKASSLIRDGLERRRVADLLIEACHLSRKLSAFDAALHFVKTVKDDFSDLFANNRDYEIEVLCIYHLTLCSMAKYEEADDIYKELTTLTYDPLILADNCCEQSVSLSNRSRYQEAVDLSFGMLKDLGVDYPGKDIEAVTEKEVDVFYEKIRTPGFNGLTSIGKAKSPVQIAIGKIASRIYPPSLFNDPTDSLWLSVMGSNRLLDHGYTANGLQLYSYVGMTLIPLRGDYHTANKVIKDCIKIAEKNEYHHDLARLYHAYSLLYLHWVDDQKKSINYAREAFKGCIEAGDIEFATFTYYTILMAYLETADQLDDIWLEAEKALSFAEKTDNNHAHETYRCYYQLCKALMGETDGPGSFRDDFFDKDLFVEENTNNVMSLCYYYTLRALSAVIFSEYETALELTEKAAPIMSYVMCFYVEAQHNFLHSLAICKKLEAEDADPGETRRLQEVLTKNQEWMGKRAKDAPKNFAHLYTVIEAERKYINGNKAEAIALYNKAIKESKKNKRPYNHALICELAVPRFMEMKAYSTATVHLQNAFHTYASWGAEGKIKQMQSKYSDMFSLSKIDNKLRSSTETLSSTSMGTHSLDLNTIVRSIRTLSEKPPGEHLLEVLLEASGAQNIIYAAPGKDGWELKAEGNLMNGNVSVSFKTRNADGLIPMKIINYVMRTEEIVVLDSPDEFSRFGTNGYFVNKPVKSVMAMPVVSDDKPKGVLYFENHSVEGIFSEENSEMLSIAVSQFVMYLENPEYRDDDSLQDDSSDYNANGTGDSGTSGELARLMLDSSPLASFVFDENMDLIDCNMAAVKLFGLFSKEEFIENFPDLSVPLQKNNMLSEELMMEYAKMAIAQKEVTFQWMYRVFEGTEIPAEVTLKKVLYNGSFRIIGYIRDMRSEFEAKEEALEADERNRAMIDAAPVWFTFWDKDCNLIDCNASMVSAFEVYDKNVIIENFYAFSPEYQEDGSSSKDTFKKVMKKALEEGYCKFEWMHQTLGGTELPTEVTLISVNYKGSYRLAGFSLDQRENKAMLSVIRKNEEELQKAKQIAEESARAKSDFLSNMSHEIRTPMNAIIGMTDIGMASDDIEKMRYCLSKVSGASTHLLEIINDVLDMSKIDSGKLELVPEAFDMEKTVENICSINTIKAEEKGIELLVDIDTAISHYVIGDKLRLSQVLSNLLSNAVKFTPERGFVRLTISLEAETEKNSTFYFEVADTGIGMTEEQISKIFTAFQQADVDITRRFGGTGLGLVISQRIIEMMGSKIEVTSDYEKGSSFYFTVTLDNSPEPSDNQKFDFEKYRDLRLLAVDDDPAFLEYFSRIMSAHDIPFSISASSTEAVDLARASVKAGSAYDIIFVDYFMEDESGIHTIRKLNDILESSTPVIIISMSKWSQIKKEALDAGSTKYISKPLFQSSIFTMMDEILSPGETKAEDPEGIRSQMQKFSGAHMLLVEDNDINQEIVMAILKDTEITIECADNGKEALDMLNNAPDKYDIILMDVQMPVMDGLTATKLIRAGDLKQAKTIPIIALTANAFKEDIDECRTAGMNDHICKPIDTEDMITKIAKYLNNQGG